jgi:hypothetical protein
MLAVILTLTLNVDPRLQEALEAQVTVPAARVEVLAWQAPSCQGRYEPAPLSASGRLAVRVRGASCDEWAWATVRLTARAAVLTQPVKAGDPLEGAWRLKEVELTRGARTLASVPASATATRPMAPGAVLRPESLRVGPPPGTPILVRVVAGSIVVEERGHVAACSGEAVCATLPGGKRVSGRFDNGALVVSMTGATGAYP